MSAREIKRCDALSKLITEWKRSGAFSARKAVLEYYRKHWGEDALAPFEAALLLVDANFIDARTQTFITNIDRFAENDMSQNDNSKHVTQTNVANSPVAFGDQEIKDAFKDVRTTIGAAAASSVKDDLTKLADLMQHLLPKLSEEKREDAARSLKTFTEEAVKAKPSRRWFEPSKEGLLEAANTVRELAAPITTTVLAIYEALKHAL